MLNDDIDADDVADAALGNNPDALTRRLNRVLHKVSVASTRLTSIKNAFPPGPPTAPQLTALTAITAQTTQITTIVTAITGGGPVQGPQ